MTVWLESKHLKARTVHAPNSNTKPSGLSTNHGRESAHVTQCQGAPRSCVHMTALECAAELLMTGSLPSHSTRNESLHESDEQSTHNPQHRQGENTCVTRTGLSPILLAHWEHSLRTVADAQITLNELPGKRPQTSACARGSIQCTVLKYL